MGNKKDNWAGVYGNDIKKYGMQSYEEEVKTVKLSQKGDVIARNRLITSNLNLVIGIVRKYLNMGLSVDELICEGNKGLVFAAIRYKDIGNKFSTFATPYIIGSIMGAIKKNNVIGTLNECIDVSFDKLDVDKLQCEQSSDYNEDENKVKMLSNMLDKLPEMNAFIMKHYYGVCGFQQMGVVEIADEIGYTPVFVSQMIDKSLNMLRINSLSEKKVVI